MKIRSRSAILVALASGIAASSASAQSLTTLFAQNNGGAVGGIVFFDVNITNPIIIDALDVNTATLGSIGATVYTVPGTYIGNENNMGAWMQVSTGSGTGLGVNLPSLITLDTPFQLSAGTYGIAIVGAAPGFASFAHSYTNGTGANQFYTNADLSMTLGAAMNIPFSGTPFTPRVFNGTVYYDPANPNAVGACCFPNGTCDFITLAACQTANGSFRGENTPCASVNCPQPGACCLSDGSCQFIPEAACGSAGGIWAGSGITCAAANCPQPAACCLGAGGCIVAVPTVCASQGGAYMGAGTACGTVTCPQPFMEIGDAGDLPATANIVEGTGPLLQIIGNASTPDDVDMFQIEICDPQNFSASTVAGATWDTTMFLFDEFGVGVVMNDDTPSGGSLQSSFTGALVPAAGTYYIALSRYARHPVSAGGRIWLATPFNTERAPDGPGATGEITGWETVPAAAGGAYTIFLTGACYISSNICYANCDGSSIEPILNVDDFTCFINEYAAAQALPPSQQLTAYANCDGSTVEPVLNVDDFTCFINAYAVGCN